MVQQMSIYSIFLDLFRYGRNIEQLKYEVRDGKEMRAEVRQCSNNDNPSVKKWLHDIDELLKDAKKVLENAGEGENTGHTNRRSLNIISQYQLSKNAARLSQNIAKSIDSDEAHSFLVSDVPSTNMLTTEAILAALQNDQISRIGLFGIAARRMTLEAMNLEKIAREKKVFDKVIRVIVPRSPDMMVIKEEIKNLIVAKSLVIFDDVHEVFDLNEIEILDKEKSKIVITSRDKRICNEMESQETFDMKRKEHICETWSTFKEASKDWLKKEVLDSIAKELAEDCDDLNSAPAYEIELKMSQIGGGAITSYVEIEDANSYFTKEMQVTLKNLQTELPTSSDGNTASESTISDSLWKVMAYSPSRRVAESRMKNMQGESTPVHINVLAREVEVLGNEIIKNKKITSDLAQQVKARIDKSISPTAANPDTGMQNNGNHEHRVCCFV